MRMTILCKNNDESVKEYYTHCMKANTGNE